MLTGVYSSPVRWCTVSPAEQTKCEAFAAAVADDFIAFAATHTSLQCVQVWLHSSTCTLILQCGYQS